MPWMECDAVELRMQLVNHARTSGLSVSDLADMFDVSRKTAHKWLRRYEEDGVEGLKDLSRAPHRNANRSSQEVLDFIMKMRRRHPTWGARKIRDQAPHRAPHLKMPSVATVHEILRRSGVVRKRRRRRLNGHPGRSQEVASNPNDIWTTDFKGHFKLKNGVYCYPFTLMDEYSRYLLACKACDGTGYEESFRAFERAFREFGLPKAIKSDNGVPFATTALARLSKLSVWWIKLGIRPILIEPASPQQNGKHERMHRTMKAEATKPPRGSKSAQQRRFNEWLEEYNEDRPHQALGGDYPAHHYRPSDREFPEKLPEVEYPGHFEVRLVSSASNFRWEGRALTVSSTLKGEYIGLEEVEDGIWMIYFSWKRIGILDARKHKILDEKGRHNRKKV